MPKGKKKRNTKKNNWRRLNTAVVSNPLSEDPADVIYKKLKQNNFQSVEPSQTQTDKDGFVIDKVGNLPLLSSQERKLRAKSYVLNVKKGLLNDPDKKNNKPPKRKKGLKRKVIKLDAPEEKKEPEDQNNKKRKNNNGNVYDIWNEVEKDDNITPKTNNPVLERGYVHRLDKHVRPINHDLPFITDKVEIIQPGGSYNPSEGEHKALLKEAVDEQLKRAEKYDNFMKKVFKRETKDEIKPIEEFDIHGEDSGISDEESSEDKEHINNPFIPRLTQAQKNKKIRRKIHEKLVKKHERRKNKKKQSLQEVIEQVKTENEMLEERKKERSIQKEIKKHQTQIVGHERIPERDVEVLLTEQLPNSLRELQPQSDLLEERFVSFQKRNLIEPRSEKLYNRRYALRKVLTMRHREYIGEQEKIYNTKLL